MLYHVFPQGTGLGGRLVALLATEGFLPTVDQLMPLKLAGGGEPLVTKLAAILFVELFFQHGQLKRKGNV